MKNIFLKFITIVIITLGAFSCNEEDNELTETLEVEEIIPSVLNLNLEFNTEDHSIITITPEGNNVNIFHIYFGDLD